MQRGLPLCETCLTPQRRFGSLGGRLCGVSGFVIYPAIEIPDIRLSGLNSSRGEASIQSRLEDKRKRKEESMDCFFRCSGQDSIELEGNRALVQFPVNHAEQQQDHDRWLRRGG